MFDYKFDVSLTNAEIMRLNSHFNPLTRRYRKGESVTRTSSSGDTIGIIRRGTAYLVSINRDAQRRILDYYVEGDLFRLTPQDDEELFLTAKTACDVDFISYERLMALEDRRLRELLSQRLFGETRRRLLRHLDVLGQRTLRSKLTVYFEQLAAKQGSRLTLPIPYSDLADYIAADRSAMMRELSAMERDGILSANKGEVVLSE